jgi:phosphohistidine phosphatase
MRRLLLLRHGKADRHSAGGDRERPLTKRGEEDARRMGEYLMKEGLAPELAVTSDARRAKRTLDLVLDAFPSPAARQIESSVYLATEDQLLQVLRQTPDKIRTLLAVGHNPGFAELAISLANSGKAEDIARLRAKFPTAALAVLDFEADHWANVGQGDARLAYFITPAALRDDASDELD